MALCSAGGTSLSDAYRFDGFGQQIASAGTAANPWRYRGLLNIGSDSLTWALLDMGARDYAPQLGAFTQLDSVQGQAANPLSMNRFLYALANPATLIDPDGHCPFGEYESCGSSHDDEPPPNKTEDSDNPPPAKSPDVEDRSDPPDPTGPTYSPDELRFLQAVAKYGDPRSWGKTVHPPCREWAPEEACQEAEQTGAFMVIGLLTFAAEIWAAGALSEGVAVSQEGKAASLFARLQGWYQRLVGSAPFEQRAVELAVKNVEAMGQAYIRSLYSEAQERAAAKNESLDPLFYGYRFHQAVRDELDNLFPDSVIYNYRGVDFTRTSSDIRVELTTSNPSALAEHYRTYGQPSPTLWYVTYTPPWAQ